MDEDNGVSATPDRVKQPRPIGGVEVRHLKVSVLGCAWIDTK